MERSNNPIKNIKAFFKIKKIAKDVEPDIIHLHSSKAGTLGRVAFNGYKVNDRPVPLFYTPHGYSSLMENHRVAKRMPYKIIEGDCGKLNCTTISCSEGRHQEMLKLNKRAAYMNNGITVKELEQNLGKIKIEDHSFTVFTLGCICHQKKPELFIEVAETMTNDIRITLINSSISLQLKPLSSLWMTSWFPIASLITQSFFIYIASSNNIGSPSHSGVSINASAVRDFSIAVLRLHSRLFLCFCSSARPLTRHRPIQWDFTA